MLNCLNDDIVLAIATDPDPGWFFPEDIGPVAAAVDDDEVNPWKVNTYDGLLLLLLLAFVGVLTELSALTTLLLFLVDNELPIAVGLFFG